MMRLAPNILLILIVLVSSCSKETENVSTPELNTDPKTLSIEPTPIITATLGDQTITLEDLDQTIRLKKYDLEWSLYELRLAALDQYIEKLNEQNSLSQEGNILLRPPMPPRVDIPVKERYIIGNKGATIKIAVFCSYQSSPCMRIQPIIENLRLLYGDLVAVVPYDLPMHFHRNGRTAANAARCAASFSMLEHYQQGLYSDINKLGRERYIQIASQLNLDSSAFSQCYDDKRFDRLIQADMDFGKSLNTGNVPIVFINGLYTKGPKTISTYIYFIETELERMGIVYEHQQTHKETPNESIEKALNEPINSDESVIDEDPIEEESYTSSVDNLKTSSTMILSREWLEDQLLNQVELQESFVSAEHLVNNQYYLLRLENTAEKEFYKTLGLEERDVIMQVNDEWVHSGQNSLFNELHAQDRVSVVLMRKGLPYRYDFQIQ